MREPFLNSRGGSQATLTVNQNRTIVVLPHVLPAGAEDLVVRLEDKRAAAGGERDAVGVGVGARGGGRAPDADVVGGGGA